MATYPPFLPDQCPPHDAVSANGRFYRMVKVTPETRDMHSHYEKGQPFDGDDMCEFCSVSVFDSYEIIRSKLIKRCKGVAKKLAKNRVAVIELNGAHGVIKQTFGPHHWSWWPYHSVDRLSTITSMHEVNA